MSREEWLEFLASPVRTAKLATVRPDGRPHVVPVWFDLDGDQLVFTTGATTVKGRSIRRDPRACLCVDDEAPPFSFVMLEGTTSFTEDPEELLHWATRIGGRYMGPHRATEYGTRNAVPGELLVRFTPTHVIAERDIAD